MTIFLNLERALVYVARTEALAFSFCISLDRTLLFHVDSLFSTVNV